MFYPNPRGSSNYGQKTLAANVNDWGGGDYKDIMTGVDALVARGIADPDKLAHIGWSYGGYMTAWVITQTTRFKAAMVGAGLTNMWSMYGTNDIPSVLIAYFGGIPNKQTLPLYLDRSAMSHIDKVTTPTLILHGANDERVPVGQAYELYRGSERSRQDDRARVLSARGPRHPGVLPPERSNAADLRLGDEVHFRHRWKQNDRAIALRLGSSASGQTAARSASSGASDAELLTILAELAREVSSVLDLDELLEKIPQLISRLTNFTVFSVYLLNEKREELSIAYAVGYPEEIVKHFTLRVGQGTVGTAVAEQRPILLNDVDSDPRYLAVVPGARSQLAVPLRNKGQVIGALNLLSDSWAPLPSATNGSCASSAPTWPRPSPPRGCSNRSASTRRRSRRWRRSAAR